MIEYTYNGTKRNIEISGSTNAVTMNGQQLTTLPHNTTRTLNTAGKYVPYDIVIDNKRLKTAGTFVSGNIQLKNVPSVITVPSSPSAYTYDGNTKSCGITVPSGASIVGGTTSAVNAGAYYVTLRLNNTVNTCWNDGSISDKVVSWTINKANASITVSRSSHTMISNKINITIGYTEVNDPNITGRPTVSVDSTSVRAYYYVNNIVVSRKDSAARTVNITISRPESQNWTAASTTFAVIIQEYEYRVGITDGFENYTVVLKTIPTENIPLFRVLWYCRVYTQTLGGQPIDVGQIIAWGVTSPQDMYIEENDGTMRAIYEDSGKSIRVNETFTADSSVLYYI